MAPSVTSYIKNLTPEKRLENILWERRILGFPPFGWDVTQPMVCISESPARHLKWLLNTRKWPPWGGDPAPPVGLQQGRWAGLVSPAC
jgi:hypothetical protein